MRSAGGSDRLSPVVGCRHRPVGSSAPTHTHRAALHPHTLAHRSAGLHTRTITALHPRTTTPPPLTDHTEYRYRYRMYVYVRFGRRFYSYRAHGTASGNMSDHPPVGGPILSSIHFRFRLTFCSDLSQESPVRVIKRVCSREYILSTYPSR